jgi:serine/threonine protein kinase/tetratricopeptide (TPR) repeat protein
MQTNSERDARVMNIVSQARHQPPTEREPFLRSVCETDSNLYQEIAETLEWEARMGNFLQQPLVALTVVGRLFRPGEVIDGRFEIVRTVGEGGMGVVYEAIDRKRNLRIAIKSAKPGFQRLLSPELEGALKVRHPNVCLVNQIHTTKTDAGEVDFLSMEFLEGKTLSAHLDSKGKLDPAAALELVRQLCAGLSEAHHSGVVHGDLKSANIILSQHDDGSLRPVITDFGLASGANQPSRTLGGTPDYMAPELLLGQKTSKASDVYALGVILYEIISGRLPFVNQSVGSHPTRPPAPSDVVKGLDPRWDGVILDCLSESPAARPTDAAQIIVRLEKRPLRKAPLIAVGVLILAALSPPTRKWATDAFMDRFMPANVRLAILPLHNPSEATMVGEGALHDVSARLLHIPSARRTLVVIPPGVDAGTAVQTAEQAVKVLHATHALRTTLRREGNDYIVEGSVLDLHTQAHLRDFSTRYSEATVGALPSALASEVSLALRLPTAAAPEVLSPKATAPYDKGLYLLRTDEQTYEDAISLFREAARLDPRSPLPPAALVEAQVVKCGIIKGHHCLAEAQQALGDAESLNPDSARVRLAGGLLNQATGKYQKALEDYNRVLELEPRNIDALLQIASVYFRADMPDKAIIAYQKAIELDPGYYLPHEELGSFHYFRGEYREAMEQFKVAIDRAPGRAVAYSNLGATLMDLGEYGPAERSLLQSLEVRETAPALNNMGAVRAYQRRDAEAVDYYQRAIRINPNDYIFIQNLADSYRRLGRSREATHAYKQALNLGLAALAENPLEAFSRGFVAYCSARLGDDQRAQTEIGQALKLSPGNKSVIRNAVLTYEALGQREQSIAALRGATPELLRELEHHPDLADLSSHSRFQQLVTKIDNGGK